jgi:Skp family chaperone for outer membrane proteins
LVLIDQALQFLQQSADSSRLDFGSIPRREGNMGKFLRWQAVSVVTLFVIAHATAHAGSPETAICANGEADVCKSAQALKDELNPKYKQLEKEARDYCAKYAKMENYQDWGKSAAPSVCAQNYINKTNPQLDDAYREAILKRDKACRCPDI